MSIFSCKQCVDILVVKCCLNLIVPLSLVNKDTSRAVIRNCAILNEYMPGSLCKHIVLKIVCNRLTDFLLIRQHSSMFY